MDLLNSVYLLISNPVMLSLLDFRCLNPDMAQA